MKLSDILAKLTGKNEETQEVIVPSQEELATLATALSTKETELTELATSLSVKEEEVKVLETAVVSKAVTLTEKETALTVKETELTTKEANLTEEISKAALKNTVNGTEAIKPEKKGSDIALQIANEKDPAKRFSLYQEHLNKNQSK